MTDKRSGTALAARFWRGRSVAPRKRRGPRPRAISRSGHALHLIGAIAMLLGMFLPLTDAGRALAAPASPLPAAETRNQSDVTTTSFTQVAAIGDFQSQFGCGDFDPFCQGTALTNHSGIWTGNLPIQPGSYSWQVAAITQDGQQFIFGRGGLNGDRQDLNIAEGDVGAFFRFNAPSQTVDAASLDALYTLATDVGAFALQPDGDNLTAIVQTQGGGLNAELQIDGAPVGNPQFIQVEQGPSEVTLDKNGTILNVEALGYATLTISRTDANDQPLGGGCYEVRDGNTVVSRGCDTDDGAVDGRITLAFPEGFDAGGFTIVEVTAPDGADTADDQDVDLQDGDNSVQITTGQAEDEGGLIEGTDQTPTDEAAVEEPTQEEATEEPAEPTAEEQPGPPGNLVVTLQDDSGQPIGNACFELRRGDETVATECDDPSSPGDAFPGNGNTGFFGVPSGTYTLHQSFAPEGTEPVEDQEVEVPADDQLNITVTAARSAEPTEEPTPEPTEVATGDVVALRQDAEGNPVGGSCFQIVDTDGNAVGDAVCDEDGDAPDDGRTGLFDVPAGSYVLRETRTPEGYEPAPDTPFDVQGGQAVDVPVRSAVIATEEPTAEPTEEPTEEATEEPTAEPTEEIAPTEEATQEAEPGNLVVTLQDENGQPIGFACFQLKRGDEVVADECDDVTSPGDAFPGNGNTGFFGVPSGTFTLHQSGAPEGTQPVEDQEVEVPANDQLNITVTAPSAAETPTEEVTPTEEEVTPTEEPTEEPAPTEETVAPTTGGNVAVDVSGLDQSQGPICIELNTSGGIGMMNPPSACDNADGDADGEAGTILLQDVPAGEYALFITQGPEDALNAEPLPVTVVDGETATVGFAQEPTPEPTATTEPTPEPTATPEPGGIVVSLIDTDGQPITAGGGCVTVEGVADPVCDDAGGDQSGDPGVLEITGLPAGDLEVNLTQAPEGYELTGQPVTVTVAAGEVASVAIELDEAGPTTGTLSINVVNADEAAIPGGCFTIANADGTLDICDEDNDGTLTADGLSFLETTVTQTSAADGYVVAEPQTVTFSPEAATADLTFVNEVALGILPVIATDANDEPIGGACWTLSGDGGEFGPLCDDGANGGTELDGQVQFEQLPPGTYTLSETQPPTGFQAVDGREVTVAAGTNDAVRVAHEVATSTVQVTTQDGQGGVLVGACYVIDDREPLCDVDGDGIVNLTDVGPGDHTVSQSTAPDGYRPAADQDITVTAGEDVQLVFQNAPLTGSIAVNVVDEDGAPIAGGCVAIDGGDQVCDDEDGDASTDPGTIQIDGLALGEHQVTLESVSEDFELPTESQTATVEADAVATVTFTLARVQPQTGGVDVTVQIQDGDVVPGACVTLTSTAEGVVLGPFCDGDDQDSNDAPGVIGIDDVPVGIYIVTLVESGQATKMSFQAAPNIDVTAADSPSVEIVAGERAQVTVTLPPVPVNGTARIVTRDGQTLVGGACYELQGADGTTAVCDGDDNDADGTTGVIEINDLPADTYTLVMSTPPAGYETAPERDLTIVAGETTTVEVQVTALPQPGTLTVAKVDGNGDPLGGACFALQQNGGTIATQCDADDAGPNDGTLVFEDLAAGSYRLVETRVPSNAYENAAPRTVTITAGENTNATVTNIQKPGRLVITTVDSADGSVRLNNACYRLDGAETYGPFCDADDGSVNGRVVFGQVAAGEYTLVENVAPAGYQAAENRTVTIAPGATLQITVENAKTPPPAQTGTLVVIKLDGANKDLPGGCFQLLEGTNPITDPVCDIDDGTNNARIVFTDAPVGTWTLRETLAPSTSYVLAEDREVTIERDQTTEVEVVNVLKQGRVLVRAVNEDGQTLQNACFDLARDNKAAQCTNAAGETLFENLAVGTYALSQTQAPYGYEMSDATQDVQVQPGQTTIVRVVFKAAPPPNTGSVQVQKFYCPAGEQGERTQFLGGAQGNAQLAKTAGCSQGNAAFTLVAEDGSGSGPGAFTTGADGRYQVTVPQGIYVLSETDPDLPGASSARLRVVTGQMTTVVVINYIAPPEPEPVTINVVAYTCPPSFNGTLYDDFAQSCRTEQGLTNNLTVRAEGPVNAKQVTGDQGKLGVTSFRNLQAGKYTVFGEKPFNIPLMYQFCGPNGDWPSDQKAINGSLRVNLDYGQAITCHFFQIPENLTKDTGTILVQKFSCPVDKAPKGYDWKNECERSDTQMQFALNSYNAETQSFEEFTAANANPDGILRFTALKPGTYELKEVGATWCFAQSNSVDAKGNVVVQPSKLAEVWIYNCVGTKEPPNTGSGDAAALLNPAGDDNMGGLILMNLAWPVLAVAAWLLWRSRRPATLPVTVRSGEHRRHVA